LFARNKEQDVLWRDQKINNEKSRRQREDIPQGLEAEETPSSDVGSSEPKQLDLTQIDFEPNSRVSLLADGDKVPRVRVVEQARQSGAAPVLKQCRRRTRRRPEGPESLHYLSYGVWLVLLSL
jgi:hypothetical protein